MPRRKPKRIPDKYGISALEDVKEFLSDPNHAVYFVKAKIKADTLSKKIAKSLRKVKKSRRKPEMATPIDYPNDGTVRVMLRGANGYRTFGVYPFMSVNLLSAEISSLPHLVQGIPTFWRIDYSNNRGIKGFRKYVYVPEPYLYHVVDHDMSYAEPEFVAPYELKAYDLYGYQWVDRGRVTLSEFLLFNLYELNPRYIGTYYRLESIQSEDPLVPTMPCWTFQHGINVPMDDSFYVYINRVLDIWKLYNVRVNKHIPAGVLDKLKWLSLSKDGRTSKPTQAIVNSLMGIANDIDILLDESKKGGIALDYRLERALQGFSTIVEIVMSKALKEPLSVRSFERHVFTFYKRQNHKALGADLDHALFMDRHKTSYVRISLLSRRGIALRRAIAVDNVLRSYNYRTRQNKKKLENNNG